MFWKELTVQQLNSYLDLIGSLDNRNRLTLQQARQMLQKTAEYPYYKIFCFNDEVRMIATYSLIVLDNFGHGGRKIALVENVVVAEEARRQGIGRQMMNDAIEHAKSENCYKLMLSSDAKRVGAHAFYEHLGFEKHGISFRMELEQK